MTDLSPAARAVLYDAHNRWLDVDDDIPAQVAAAALRAAVKQLATYAGVQGGYQRHLIDADEILSIAAELEAQ